MNLEEKNTLSKYSVELSGNKLILRGTGIFSKEDAENCVNDIIKAFNEIETSKLILVIDQENLKMAFPNTKILYEKMAEIYIKSNFKNKYILMPESEIAWLQIKKSDNKLFKEIKVISRIDQAI